MKHLSRVLCLLLMLALLLPGALAEPVEQTEQIDSGIEEDEVEKVGDIFDMYCASPRTAPFTATKHPPCCLWMRTARCCCSTPTPTA